MTTYGYLMMTLHPRIETDVAPRKSTAAATTFTDSLVLLRNEDSVDHILHLRIENGRDILTESYEIPHNSQQIVSITNQGTVRIELWADHGCGANISLDLNRPDAPVPEFTVRSTTISVARLH